MKKTRYFGLLLLFIGISASFSVRAQDPQFTQFYAAPLFVNPAFTGASGEGRLIANYRNQWPGLEANFITYAFSYDQYFPLLRSGFGFMAKRDEQGGGSSAPLISTDASIFYSYMIPINSQWAVQAGLHAGYGFRDLNFGNLLFGDQIGPDGNTGQPTNENLATDRIGYFDVGGGLLLYTSRFWAGVSFTHLNQPNMAFLNDTDQLAIRRSVHMGYQIPFGRGLGPSGGDFSITPAFMYLGQGSFDQFSVGAYLNYQPMLLGLWYRGIPVKNSDFQGVNQDALAVVVGLKLNDITFGYSYDYTISQLSNANTYGAHEISVIYNFRPKETGRRKPVGYPRIDCPNPWKSYQRLNYRHVNTP